jgi:hypothetical protein
MRLILVSSCANFCSYFNVFAAQGEDHNRTDHSVSGLMMRTLDLTFQIPSDLGELGESSFQVFDDFLSNDVGIGKVGTVFK